MTTTRYKIVDNMSAGLRLHGNFRIRNDNNHQFNTINVLAAVDTAALTADIDAISTKAFPVPTVAVYALSASIFTSNFFIFAVLIASIF